MPKFLISETIHSEKVITARLGTTVAKFADADVNKAVKLSAESAYALCSAGDAIEGVVSSLTSPPTYDGFSVGGIVSTGYVAVTFSGAAVAIGDYVVAAAQPALGTKNTGNMLVQKAADQVAAKAAPFKWRVVSLGTVGTGAAGTVGVIERV